MKAIEYGKNNIGYIKLKSPAERRLVYLMIYFIQANISSR